MGGGDPVNRVDYSNDTATALERRLLMDKDSGSASSTTHGYFGGGAPGGKSTISRLDYSNDTANSVARGRDSTQDIFVELVLRENANPLIGLGILELAKAFAPFGVLAPPAPTGFDFTGYFGELDFPTVSARGPWETCRNSRLSYSTIIIQ